MNPFDSQKMENALEPRLCLQSSDGRVRDPEGAGDVRQRVAVEGFD